MPQTVAHPIGVRDLPPGLHACRTCGLPVDGPTEPAHVYARQRPSGLDDIPSVMIIEFGTCDDCATRQRLATAVLERFPKTRLSYGSMIIIAPRFHYVLVTFAALGRPIPTIDDWTPATLRSALDRLEVIGHRFTWAARFSPVWQADAREDTAASERWLYVDTDTLADARRGYAEWLLDQRPPHPIDHPRQGGCVACGVGAHLGRREREAWHRIDSGKHRGQYLCATCHRHYGGQVLGQTLIDACLLDLLDADHSLRRKRPYAPRFTGVRLWADTGRAPSRAPWGHVDLTAIRHDVETGAW
ncbi:hypothetical protein ACH3VR_21420 [Microbacterium sp. B2969]|uniref:Uncharacterized protein n=1 Tax=Microbacterium alkaliflavum TaxID=3248839 RepID=A0ABW7QDH0_9MICO